MPIRVFYQNDINQSCTIRPTPLVSISTQILKNAGGENFGVTYTITLTGTLLSDQGSPYGFRPDKTRYATISDLPNPIPNNVGPYGAFDNNRSHADNARPPSQNLDNSINNASASIFSKQKALRALFSIDGQLTEISDFATGTPSIFCYPRVINIDFQEGIYIDRCEYTITLEADTLLTGNNIIDIEGNLIPKKIEADVFTEISESALIGSQYLGAFLTDFNEEWAIETDEQPENENLIRTYRITHTVNATGKTHYGPINNDKYPDAQNVKITAYESAKKFVLSRLRFSPALNYDGLTGGPSLEVGNTTFGDEENKGYPNLNNGDYRYHKNPNTPNIPTNNIANVIGQGTLDLALEYKGYNHIRSEQSNVNAGTFSVTETWVLAKNPVFENYNISINSSIDSPFVSVTIDGNIKGLSEISARGYGGYGDRQDSTQENSGKKTGYENALLKYNQITNSGQFGLTSDVYKRANNVVAIQLNSQPKSISLGSSPSTSELTYNVQFDNRPTNLITGAIAEVISVNDTYPGDMFSVIPVIGRKTGPILQYIGGRTEYKRDLQINLTMDYTKISYGPYRSSFMLQKPSIIEPTASEIANLIDQFSPANEPGIRKYFVSAPTENWNPKEGTYSLNIGWTYELDK